MTDFTYVEPSQASSRYAIPLHWYFRVLCVLTVAWGTVSLYQGCAWLDAWLTVQLETIRQDDLAERIAETAHVLRFTVADHEYVIRTPSVAMDADMRKAWFGYAQRRGFPLYAADGPLAVDP